MHILKLAKVILCQMHQQVFDICSSIKRIHDFSPSRRLQILPAEVPIHDFHAVAAHTLVAVRQFAFIVGSIHHEIARLSVLKKELLCKRPIHEKIIIEIHKVLAQILNAMQVNLNGAR